MTKEEYEKLVAEVNRLRNNLHLFNEETISESALDDLKRKITAFEAAHPDLISPDSPNYTIAGGVAEKFEKFAHKRRMLSLNDIFTLEELQAWEIDGEIFTLNSMVCILPLGRLRYSM